MSIDQVPLTVFLLIAVLLLTLVVLLHALRLPRSFFESMRQREEIRKKLWVQQDRAEQIREQIEQEMQ